MLNLLRVPGARLISHLVIVLAIWAALMRVNDSIDPLMSYYLALAAMYATAMFGMVILVGLSGQVSLGNGALMAIGGYVFALTSLNWQTVPILGWQWNPIWSMIFAGFGGIAVGLIIGWIGARLQGPYLAGLTLGIAVGVPAIATRFPALFGGETGLMLTVPYPDGGYPADSSATAPTTETMPVDETMPLDETLPVDESMPVEQVPLDEIPTEQAPLDGASAGAGDLLTADNFPTAAATPAAEDLLTADNFPSDAAVPSTAAIPTEVDPLPGADALLSGTFVLERWQASLAVTAACIIGFIALNLVRGRQGRVWRAVRDDSVAAAVSGISPAGSKISAFVVSSFFAAIAGAVFAQILSYVGPGAFGLGLSLSLLVGVVLGGRASLGGAIIGGILLVVLPQLVITLSEDRGWPANVTDNAPNLLYGLLVVLVVLIAPGGILGSLQSGIQRLVAKTRSTH